MTEHAGADETMTTQDEGPGEEQAPEGARPGETAAAFAARVQAYEDRVTAKRERLTAAADRARRESAARFASAAHATAGIPSGQPVLVDHYSAPRHRAALARHDTHMRAGFAADAAAADYASRAASVGTGGISSDDPNAIPALTRQRDDLEVKRANCKAANVAWRAAQKGATDEEVAALLVGRGHTLATLRASMATMPSYEREPFPPYHITNMGANIRRIEKRIAELKARAAEPVFEGATVAGTLDGAAGTCEVSEDRDENRVRLRFPKRWETLRGALHRRGFVWSPRAEAWQRKASRGVADLALRTVRETLTAHGTLGGAAEGEG